jgi:hypothetical protein
MHGNIVDPEESDEECEQVRVLVYTGCILLGKCSTPMIAQGKTQYSLSTQIKIKNGNPNHLDFYS